MRTILHSRTADRRQHTLGRSYGWRAMQMPHHKHWYAALTLASAPGLIGVVLGVAYLAAALGLAVLAVANVVAWLFH